MSTIVSNNGRNVNYLDIVPDPIPPVSDDKAAKDTRQSMNDFLLAQGTHDEGNAQCVYHMYNGKFARNEAIGWARYNGKYYEAGGAAEAALGRAIVATLKARVNAALDSGDADKHKDIFKKCIPNASAVNSIKDILGDIAYVPVSAFDTDPDSINTDNGVVNLRTGKITPHSPEQRFTHCTTVGYNPNADYSEWVKWLTGTVGSKEITDWLQVAVGYTLTGHTNEEILFYLFGPPRSGKGTFTEVLMAILGKPLSSEVGFATFTAERGGDDQNFDLAPLRSCRFVAASESKAHERLDDAKVKRITGGNEIWCAFKHKTHFGYKPQYKIWLSSNNPVNADPDDDAVWGRIRVIEFPHSHLGKEDKALKYKMMSKSMKEAVLAWAITGAMKWYKLGAKGLSELQSSKRLKNEQREELDHVQKWLDEYVEESPGTYLVNQMAYASYETWCRENGVTAKKLTGFTQALKKKGIQTDERKIEGRKTRGFVGIRL